LTSAKSRVILTPDSVKVKHRDGDKNEMKIGLTLGKFAPFHKGHEYLINRALSETEELIVIVYNASETTDVPTTVRANWIKTLFPQVRIILAEDGPQETGYTKEIIEKQNAYLKKLLRGISIDTFFSSEEYGEYVSQALSCKNVIVDMKRSEQNISSTEIRKDIIRKRGYLSSLVFNALKPRFYFLGGPSTGKSTISLAASESLKGSYCEEYGREYWMTHQENHRLSMDDLEIIVSRQNELEDEKSIGESLIMFCDTNAITTLAYAIYYFNRSSERLLKTAEENVYKYKRVFLCDNDIPFADTWDRSGSGSRDELQKINIELLKRFGIPYQVLSGTVDNRLHLVRAEVEGVLNGKFF
jgi:HTH-type transcriptional regulator, transcriptional repressor of NAD biosynthesis genes